MIRLKDEFLEKIEGVASLHGKDVLEVGCGNGKRSIMIAAKCGTLAAIDPSEEKIVVAQQEHAKENITYYTASAEKLPFLDASFDVVIFTLSLHHVPEENMATAINEAVRVLRPKGHVIFLEPTTIGTYFDAEITFDACDGGEENEKAAAYAAMKLHPKLVEIAELDDETILRFDSDEDFIKTMEPKKNLEAISAFLQAHDYILHAMRRINIFTK